MQQPSTINTVNTVNSKLPTGIDRKKSTENLKNNEKKIKMKEIALNVKCSKCKSSHHKI